MREGERPASSLHCASWQLVAAAAGIRGAGQGRGRRGSRVAGLQEECGALAPANTARSAQCPETKQAAGQAWRRFSHPRSSMRNQQGCSTTAGTPAARRQPRPLPCSAAPARTLPLPSSLPDLHALSLAALLPASAHHFAVLQSAVRGVQSQGQRHEQVHAVQGRARLQPHEHRQPRLPHLYECQGDVPAVQVPGVQHGLPDL